MISRFLLFFFLTAALLLPSVRAADPPSQKNRQPDAAAVSEDAYAAMADFLAALAIIRTHYVDAGKVSWKNLFQAALRGLMNELDPFSAYESPEDFKSVQEDVAGERIGIGISVTANMQGLVIVAVTPQSPAEKAGLKAGDLITRIDGYEVKEMNLHEAVSRIRGERKTEVLLTVYRSSNDKTWECRVMRDVFPVASVQGAQIIPGTDGIAYLRILQFGKRTPEEFEKALEDLEKKGMHALIVDLRDNPGGLLASVIPVCSRFISPETPVVSIEGRDNKRAVIRSLKTGKHDLELPLVILINRNSASAAEIFAACMHDYKRAVLIGEQSFGKGSVQTVIPFGEKNGALRLTTALYFTPGRLKIHGRGITPDIEIPLSSAIRNRLSMQINLHPGELLPLMQNPVRDVTLERALDILKSLRIFRSAHTNTKNTGFSK